MLFDTLANALSNILNHERIGKHECDISPTSKIIKKVLEIMNEHGYIGKYEELTKAKGGVMRVYLLGQINSCKVIKPRFKVKKGEYERFEKRYLPAKGLGIIIVSTSKGLVTHEKAKELGLGGRLILYCY